MDKDELSAKLDEAIANEEQCHELLSLWRNAKDSSHNTISQIEYYRDRLLFWKAQRQKLEQEIKTSVDELYDIAMRAWEGIKDDKN